MQRNEKICICSFTGFKSLNGANLRVYHFARELLKRGHDLYFITPGRDSAETCRDRFGVKALDVGLKIDRFDKSRLKKYPLFALRAGRKVDRDTDLVFGQSLPSALAVKRSKIRGKRIVEYVDLWSEYWLYANQGLRGRITYRIVRKAECYSLKGPDRIFTITKKLSSFLENRGADHKKIRIIRDGADTKMFRPQKPSKALLDKYNLGNEDYVVYQGGIGAHDGVQFLVGAAPFILKEKPETKFLIVGKGEYLPKIKDMVRKSGLESSFMFTGWVPYEDMPFFMNLAKLNIVPIPNSPATQGVVTLKLFEAMACGTPTVIGDLPGVRENVKHRETAYLVRSENKQSLSKAVLELLDNKKLYKKISRNGLKLIPHHDWRLIAKEMADNCEF